MVYEGKGDECDTLLYAESFNLTLGGGHLIDLTKLKATATCRCDTRFYWEFLYYGIFGEGFHISSFDQSEARKLCFFASDWSRYETLPRRYRTLLATAMFDQVYMFVNLDIRKKVTHKGSKSHRIK